MDRRRRKRKMLCALINYNNNDAKHDNNMPDRQRRGRGMPGSGRTVGCNCDSSDNGRLGLAIAIVIDHRNILRIKQAQVKPNICSVFVGGAKDGYGQYSLYVCVCVCVRPGF